MQDRFDKGYDERDVLCRQHGFLPTPRALSRLEITRSRNHLRVLRVLFGKCSKTSVLANTALLMSGGDLRWCEVHQRWCRTDTARAGLLDDQQEAAPLPPSKNFALPPFRRFNHNVVITWLMTVRQPRHARQPQPSRPHPPRAPP